MLTRKQLVCSFKQCFSEKLVVATWLVMIPKENSMFIALIGRKQDFYYTLCMIKKGKSTELKLSNENKKKGFLLGMFSSERLHTKPKIRPLFCILFKKMIYTCCLILSSAFWEISSVRELIWSFASTIKDTNNIIIKWNHFAKPKFKVQKYLFVAAFPGKSPRVRQKMGANSLPYLPSVILS